MGLSTPDDGIGVENEEDEALGWISPSQAGWPALTPFVFRLANATTTTAGSAHSTEVDSRVACLLCESGGKTVE